MYLVYKSIPIPIHIKPICTFYSGRSRGGGGGSGSFVLETDWPKIAPKRLFDTHNCACQGGGGGGGSCPKEN